MNTGWIIFSGFGLGLLASVHCIAMCGPLAMNLPIYHQSKWQRLYSIILYNLGRAFTYMLLGFIMGFIGNSFKIAGFQNVLSITIGVLILFWFLNKKVSIFKINQTRIGKFFNDKYIHLLSLTLKTQYIFLFGAINGLLPCGMVYIALGSSLALGNPMQSSLFMLLFGWGTFPLMILVMYVAKSFYNRYRFQFGKMSNLIAVLVGVFLIYRGSGTFHLSLNDNPAKNSIICKPINR
jgi:sulfite exporter TauE/SafE